MPQDNSIFIKDLTAGQDITASYLVLNQSLGRTKQGGSYLNVELGDKTGRIGAKVWDEAESLQKKMAEGTVVLVRGYVDSYRGKLQLVIREVRPLAPEEFVWDDFILASLRPLEEMKADLADLVYTLTDKDYRRLLEAVLVSPEVADKFLTSTAAKNLHHAYYHGLLEHSLSVGRLAWRLAEHYPRLNRDLLITGALLHDFGKIWEFTPQPVTDYTTIGRLKGHLVLGSEFLGRLASTLDDFPEEKLVLLQHIILSHHGVPEFGAPVRPQILEALVIHHLDNIDARLEAVTSFIEANTDDRGWSDYHRLFGGYYFRTPQAEPGQPQEIEPEKPLVQNQDQGQDVILTESESSDDKDRLF